MGFLIHCILFNSLIPGFHKLTSCSFVSPLKSEEELEQQTTEEDSRSPSKPRSRLSRLSRSMTITEETSEQNQIEEEEVKDLVTRSRETLVADLREHCTQNRYIKHY
jgi:hypothetical protein